MPNFKYKARDKFAKPITGVITADSEEDTANKLRGMGYTPISVSKASEVTTDKVMKKISSVKLHELHIFTRQLYSLQKAGVNLVSSLQAISQQTESKYFKGIIEEVLRDVQGGSTLSQAFAKHPRAFDSIYTGMIKAAEASGRMIEVLERISALIEQEIRTRSNIKSATRYPIIAFCALCIGFLIVITFVVPRFASLYAQYSADLPLPTRIMITTNLAIRKFWYIFLIAGPLIVFAFKKFINSDRGRPIWDNFKLGVPVFGPLLLLILMSRFARVTAILIKSGIPILEVLNLVAASVGNTKIVRAIDHIKESVSQGKGIAGPMRVSGLFPPIVVQMVSIGEDTGSVDELLMGVADYYDQEIEYMIKNLTSYIEPLLILVLGTMVLIMALGIFMPMWNLMQLFKH